MILANVSCSREEDFQIEFISDLCMKTLTRILNNPTNKPSKHYPVASDTTVLAVLITILNLSSLESQEVTKGMVFLGYFTTLENIIKNSELPLVTKSVSLLTISNIFTVTT